MTNIIEEPVATKQKRTSKKLEVLESMRGLAALYVFLGHFLLERVLKKESHLGFFLRFGQEAVMVFFILSGFVIYYSLQKHKDTSFRTYLSRRLNRIYPIFILCLLLTYITEALSQHHLVSLKMPQLIGNMCMLQDNSFLKPGVWVDPYYENRALWSLSYEWWFYMMFYPVNRYVHPTSQRGLVACISLLGLVTYILLPNQISLFFLYFFIWWTGVEVAKTYIAGIRPNIKNQKFSLFVLSGLTCLLGCNMLFYWKILHKPIEFGVHPVLELRHFLIAFVLVFVALSLTPKAWSLLKMVIKPFAVIAPISYAFYIMHMPLAVHGEYLSFLNQRFLELVLYVCVAILVSYVAEFPFQKWINSMWRKSHEPVSTSHLAS